MEQIEKESIFREKATAEVNDGMLAREFALSALSGVINHRDRLITEDNKRNKTASQLGESCEHFLKAPIIYHDLRNSSIIQNADELNYDSILDEHLKSPKKIQSLLLGNDLRKNKSLVADTNTQNIKVSGHDLYAYYQLQNPVFNALINHEYLTRDGEDIFNWIDLGILTRDYFDYDETGILKMPSSMLDFLDNNKNVFETKRYSSTHGGIKSATKNDIDFLIHLSGGLENIMDILFPSNYKNIHQNNKLGIDFENFRMPGSIKKSFRRLDNISTFYLNNDFSKREFELFLEQLANINSMNNIRDNDKGIYRDIYMNLCIHIILVN